MELTADGQILVVVDTSFLLNFLKINRLDLLRKMMRYAFRIPNHVTAEVKYPDQKALLEKALQQGDLEEVRLTDPDEIRIYANYRKRFGDGESACVAVAVKRLWVIAVDEVKKKRVLLQEVRDKLGEDHIMNTPGLLLQGIQRQIITVQEADQIKHELQKAKFKMKFRSFQDLINKKGLP